MVKYELDRISHRNHQTFDKDWIEDYLYVYQIELAMETLLLNAISVDEFMDKLRAMIREELKIALQQDQLLTKEGALKMTGASNAVFLKAINDGLVKPQLVKGRKKAMYLESEVLKIDVRRRRSNS